MWTPRDGYCLTSPAARFFVASAFLLCAQAARKRYGFDAVRPGKDSLHEPVDAKIEESLGNHTIPPPSDIGTQLRMEAERQGHPLRISSQRGMNLTGQGLGGGPDDSPIFGSSSWTTYMEPNLFWQQLVDHSLTCDSSCQAAGTNGNNTWAQMFYTQTSHVESDDAPIYLMLNGEGPSWPIRMFGFSSMRWFNLGIAHKANIVLLSHRYYDRPYPVANFSTANMKYLSAGDALADMARFIDYIKNPSHTIGPYSMANSKVIVFGCSYAGNLAAWARQQYPDKVQGAIASSAPVFPQWNYGPLRYQVMLSTLNSTLPGGSATCHDQVRQAIDDLVAAGTASGWQATGTLPPGLHMCRKTAPTPLDISQYAYKFVLSLTQSAGISQNKVAVSSFCKNMTDRSEDTANLLECMSALSSSNISEPLKRLTCAIGLPSDGCVSTEPPSGTQFGGRLRPWAWQVCTEFAYFMQMANVRRGGDSGYIMRAFDKLVGNESDYLEAARSSPRAQCEASFGTDFYDVPTSRTFNGTQATMDMYGGRGLPSLSKVTFVNSNFDPWMPLGMLPETAPYHEACVSMDGQQGASSCRLDPEQSISTTSDIVLINAACHCADTYSTYTEGTMNDRSSWEAAQSKIEANVKSYLE